jgi:hypothetical protein
MQTKNPHPRKLVTPKLPASKILTVLGRNWFAEFKANRTPGRVVWCNFELARSLGFDVPSSNLMTRPFHQQLIETLSYRTLTRKAVNGRPEITLYADKYGGEGIGNGLGSARSGFLPFGNLYLKGVGITPLFRRDYPEDLAQTHGGVQLNHCLGEALFGEVDQHLFTRGSTPILAIIDQGESVLYGDGRKVAIALAVRSGRQLRPGHLLSRQVLRRSILEAFINITKETKQLVTRNGQARRDEIPDIKATMLRIIDDHARATAERFRWRMIHGAVTSSNMEMGGATLDLTTRSAQPRTAPVYFREDYVSFFGHEHIDCATQLRSSYRALINSLPGRRRRALNARPFNFIREMERAYAHHLQEQLLGATGLKAEAAQRIKTEHSDLACRFTTIIATMCSLRNPGSVEMARGEVHNVSVLDVFNLLREFPRQYFAAPNNKHARFIRAALKPVFKGNRFHINKKRAEVKKLIVQFDHVYSELMNVCKGYARDYYGSRANMRVSISGRAAFENEPINLYRSTLYEDFEEAIKTYRLTGDAEVLRAIVEMKIWASRRKVDALLAQGESQCLGDGGLELEMQTINGIKYSIQAWNDRGQKRRLRVSFPLDHLGRYLESSLAGGTRLKRPPIRSLRYRFTTDGWKRSRVVGARLRKDADGCSFVSFEIASKLPLAGRLEGFSYLTESRKLRLREKAITLRGYAFAIPDQQELEKRIQS